MKKLLFTVSLLFVSTMLSAQWVQGGSFGSSIHHQACAFHDLDTGLFVYGANDPGQGEGGIIMTWSGLVGSGGYIWYTSPGNMEDIDVRMGINGRPIYLAAGHEQYQRSLVLHPYLAGGNAFQFDSVLTGNGRHYRAIRMRSDIVAFAAGGDQLGNGIIDMSTDTGYTWTNIAVLPGQPVSRLHFVNDQLGFAATGGYRRLFANGVNIPDSGAIYRTLDGGLSWTQVHSDTLTGFSDVAFLDASVGVATRNDGVFVRTTDGGDTWLAMNPPPLVPSVLSSVTFRPDGTGFAGVYRTDGVAGYILISTDAGQTWYENFNSSGLNHSRRIYDVYFFDDSHGYAATHIRPLRTNGLITGIPESTAAVFDLYPNPATDAVTLTLGNVGTVDVEIVDAAGRTVRALRTSEQQCVVEVSDLQRGTYLVRVRSGAAVQCRRMVRM
ncbi:MAG: T9SS type A sorting domain-containing protein [Flavobacteriales bacterium]|nr:T9SS type A sorting domain-containing protein [Flavobacteriales bacterium]